MSSHRWESLPAYGKFSYMLEVLPNVGRLPTYGKSCHMWEVLPVASVMIVPKCPCMLRRCCCCVCCC
jgi:hypothetical protein